MRFPVHIQPDGPFFLVTFPDIPEAITQGETRGEAMEAAAEALATALDVYLEEDRIVPTPSLVKCGGDFIDLPASLAAQITESTYKIKSTPV